MIHTIKLILLFAFLSTKCFTSAAAMPEEITAEDIFPKFIVMGGSVSRAPFPPSMEEVAGCEYLAAEVQLLHPYCTDVRKPPFYRVDFERNGKSECVFLLGTFHYLNAHYLPAAVLQHIQQSSCLATEIDRSELISHNEFCLSAVIKLHPLSPSFTKEGEGYQGTSWLDLCDPELIPTLKKVLYNTCNALGLPHLEELYTYSPDVSHEILLRHLFKSTGISYLDPFHGMDITFMDIFTKTKKPIYSLETDEDRKRISIKSLAYKGEVDTIESLVGNLINSVQILSDPEKFVLGVEEIRNYLLKKNYANDFVDDLDPLDFVTNFRNQYWIEQTLPLIFNHEAPCVVAVGAAHLKLDGIPSIGPTGLLNLFQALQKAAKTWHGIQVKGIHQLVGLHLDSDLTSERRAYAWSPAPEVPTKGPYLRDLLDSLS